MSAFSTDIRELFLAMFKKEGYRIVQPLSLVQENIKTSFLFSVGFIDVLNTISKKDTNRDRTAVVQRCFRHFDIERVGDGKHLSMFEMAGALRTNNWTISEMTASLFIFLTKECSVTKDIVHVTVFGGGDFCGSIFPKDNSTLQAWYETGIDRRHIWIGDVNTNLWNEGANSGELKSGICGPHTEAFIDLGVEWGCGKSDCGPFCCPERFLEIANIVKITHYRNVANNNNVMPLPSPLVELGVGIERLEMIVQGVSLIDKSWKYIALSEAILQFMEPTSELGIKKSYLTIVLDHTRALVHLVADGGRPGPKGRNHVVRSVIKRLMKASKELNLNVRNVFPILVHAVAKVDKNVNSGLREKIEIVHEICDKEFVRLEKDYGIGNGG